MAPTRLTKWQGGKAWLVTGHPHLIPLPSRGGRLFDCFTGSCVVALWALAQGYRVVIGDTNARLIGTLRNLKTRAEDVIRVLADIAVAYQNASDQKADFYARREHLNRCDPSDIGASALFLFILRAGFNGLYRENASGECNTPVGDLPPRKDLVRADDLRAIADLLAKADIRLGDFAATTADARRGDVVFADAPYVAPGAFTGYSKGGFALRDRQRLAAWLRFLDRRGVRWTTTDAATDHALATYGLWHVERVSVRRSVAAKGDARTPAQEVIVTNWLPEKKEAA